MTHNLPTPITPLIGRSNDVAATVRMLRLKHLRVLTLTGPGGIGKTRLAQEVAVSLVDEFEDGVYFVALATVNDSSLVTSVLARALDIEETGEQPLDVTLKKYVRDKKMLLVLDNFEHVSDAATLALELLEAAPLLKLIVTSRMALKLPGEQEFPLEPLAMPDARHLPAPDTLLNYPAVALFVARAQAARPDFALTQENAPAVVTICSRVDGLPLAIELAAARTKLLSLESLAHRLENRLKVLTGGTRNLLPHQQTLRTTLDWSYNLLSRSEQVIFSRLAVFVGSFTVDAAEVVCGDHDLESPARLQALTTPPVPPIDVFEGIASLVDKSLLRKEEGRSRFHRELSNESRTRMLETIREYALERLQTRGEAQSVRRRHAEYFLWLAEQAAPVIAGRGPDHPRWLDRLEVDYDNLRAALEWSKHAENAPEFHLRLAGALWRFWDARCRFSEGREWLEGALQASASSPIAVRANALAGAGVLADYQGDFTRAKRAFEESLALWQEVGELPGIAQALNGLGGIAAVQGEHEQAKRLYQQSLALRRKLRDVGAIAMTLNNLALVVFEQGEYATAQAYFEESLTLSRQTGDERGVARALANVGLATMYLGEYGSARALLEQSLEMYRDLDEASSIANILGNLGNVAIALGDLADGYTLYRGSLALFQELADKSGVAECLEGVASICAAQGEPQRAARLWGAAEALREAIEAPMLAVERVKYERNLESARVQLGPALFAQSWNEGRAMSIAEAIAYAQQPTSEPRTPQAVPRLPLSERGAPTSQRAGASAPTPGRQGHEGALSERELAVLRLVAQGLTDKEVAEHLIVSPRTVHAHLASIYSKLGVNSRTAATHFAIQHRLI